ncbi:hypothetical protein JCM33374_g1757 [Metschnikowia sp. JCM 33374]|nr:hypothetical protein JCM33374_g1757 [Metschnikowia sp. JCM 33374]
MAVRNSSNRKPKSFTKGMGQVSPESSKNDISTDKTRQVNKPSSLESLPVEILESIFAYLPISDLLRVCCISKDLRWPAYKWIYRRIAILDDKYVMEYYLPPQSSNFATLVALKNRYQLLSTVAGNKRIAALVQSLTLTEFHRFPKRFDISPYLTELLSHLQLESFHSVENFDVPQRSLQTVQRMSCQIFPDTFLPASLVELKLNFDAIYVHGLNFEDIASELVKSNSYRTLKKLSLDTNFNEDNVFLDLYKDQVAEGLSIWPDFFRTLSQEGIKLNLTALCLRGEFRSDPDDETAAIVGQVVELSKLETLEIQYTHYVIEDDASRQDCYYDGMHTFVNAITKNTSSLENLYIQHSDMPPQEVIQGFARALRENLRGQLKYLRSNFKDHTEHNMEMLRQTILHYQQNLVRLEFRRDPKWALDSSWFSSEFSGVYGIVGLEREGLSVNWTTDVLYPLILKLEECRPFVAEESLIVIRKHWEEILDYLNSDSIYKNAAQMLPLLSEYYVIGLYINMKERAICANRNYISLE